MPTKNGSNQSIYELNGTTYLAADIEMHGTEDGYYEIRLKSGGTVVGTSVVPLTDIDVAAPLYQPSLNLPFGTIVATARATAPAGWLICDGAAVSRTTYAALFAAIGTAYGAGDGSTTFNLPDLRQRFPMGKAASGTGNTLGASGGTIDHRHDAHTSGAGLIAAGLTAYLTGPSQHSAQNPPFLVVNYIIKAL